MATVWVIDDEPLIRHAIVSVLEQVGYRAEGFENAETFYMRLTGGPDRPDLLVVDHMLPDESGAEIVHALRERREYAQIPVLFVTAVGPDDADRLEDLAPVLRKPFDFRDLVSQVQALAPQD